MKHILFSCALLLSISGVFAQKKISDFPTINDKTGTLALVIKNNVDYKFPLDSLKKIKGGALTVQGIADRDALPSSLRDTGMIVIVRDSSIAYTLVGGITNSNWQVALAPGSDCSISFADIYGDAEDNTALSAALDTKQNALPQQGLLDIYPYYYDGHLKLQRIDSTARHYAGINSIDSVNAGFLRFSDTSNLILNHDSYYPNFDTFPCFSGFYKYTVQTRGTRPTPGGIGFLINMVAQDLKVSPTGAGRVYQLAMDGNFNLTFVRYYNGSWTAWDTLYTSSYHPGVSGGGSYYPLNGGYLVSPGFIGLTTRAGNPTTPIGDTINIFTNATGRLAIQTKYGLQANDYSSYTANRTITWDDLGGHPTLAGNTFNTANNLVQLDGTGKLPAIDGSQLTNLSSGTVLNGTGYVKMSGTTPSYVASIPSSDISLSSLSATNSSLTFSGAYNGTSNQTVGLNLANANTWTAPITMDGADILTAAAGANNIGSSANPFNNVYTNQIQGNSIQLKSKTTSQNLTLQNAGNVGLTLLGTTSYIQLNATPATNAESAPQILIRNATTGNVEQLSASNLTTKISSILIGGLNSSTLSASQTTYGVVSGQTGLGILVAKSTGMGESGTLMHAYLFTNGTQDASGSLVATLIKNGSATAIVITVPAGSATGNFSDNTHTVSVSAGDTVAWQFVNNATTTSTAVVNTSITFKQ